MKLHKRNQNAILAGSVLFAIAAGFTLPGCGSSDPTKKYSSVTAGAVPPGQAKVDDQTFDTHNILNIEALTQYMYFYEGKEGVFYFKPNLQVAGVKYTIQQAGLPTDQGMTLEAVPDSDTVHKDQIALKWNPKYGALGSENKREFKFVLTLVPNAGTDQKALDKLVGIIPYRSFSFVLLKSEDTPTFSSVEKLTGAAEGKRQSFSVVVKDVSANGGRQPYLSAFTEKNMTAAGTIPKFDAAPGVFVRGQAEALGNNLFKFQVMFDGSSITMPQGSGPAEAHFVFRVQSAGSVESLDQVIQFNVDRKAGAAPASADAASTTPAPADSKKSGTRPGTRAGTPNSGSTQNGGGK